MSRTIRICKGINDIYDNEKTKLNGEAQKITYDVGDRHYQARKVNLPKDGGIVYECVRSFGQAFREVIPHARTSEVKQRPWYSVGGDTSDAAEYDHIHQYRECRLDDKPCWSEDGLLVLGYDVSLDEQGAEIAVTP